MDIYSELTSTADEKKLGRIVTGNIDAIHTPEDAEGQNGVYPHIVSGNQHTRFSSAGFNVEEIGNISNDGTTIPSIPGNTYRVPLPFWFSG